MGKQTGSIDLRTIYVAGKDAEAISEAKSTGTINYIRNGNFNNGSEYWSAETQIGVDSKGNPCAVLGSAGQRRDDFVDTPLALKQGDKITLSFIVEHYNVSGALYIIIDISDDFTPWRYFEERWQAAAGIPQDRVSRRRFVETFTLDRDADYLRVGFAGESGSIVKITNVQVEKGETATDFSFNNGDAEIAAAEVAKQIEEQQQYFWHDSLGEHVLSDADEITGKRYRMDLKGAGQEIFELDGTTETSVAKFGADGARLGYAAGARSEIDENGQRFYAEDGTTQLANIGYGEGEGKKESGSSPISVAPYYTFGARALSARDHSTTEHYHLGDLCKYNNRVYVCASLSYITGPFNPEDWREVIGNYSFAEGFNVIASGWSSHAEGYLTKTIDGGYSHAEGLDSIAFGSSAHAEGTNTVAIAGESHTEGFGTKAEQPASHAEGWETQTLFPYSGSGFGAHAEGESTIARGAASHAEGINTQAIGDASHSQNTGTIANENNQTAIGKYNDNQSSNAFEIGNGASDTSRSNAFEVDWYGNAKAKGNIEDGSGNVLSDKLDKAGILNMFYPVGSYYETSDLTFDPNTAWGCQWDSVSAPIVIEEGTSGIWMYRKYSDGTAECFGSKTATGTFAAWGSLYSITVEASAYPTGLFVETPNCDVKVNRNTGNDMQATSIGDSANTPSCNVIRAVNASGTQSITVFYHARGKWTNSPPGANRWHRTD